MRIWPRGTYDWGSTPSERSEPLACDEVLPRPDATLHRALDVSARTESVFRWLCQLRVAPYSYDKLDNFGRRSPQTLTPGLEQLEVGQRVMSIFRLLDFEPGRSITVFSRGPVFGQVACTYRVEPLSAERSRLLVRLHVVYPKRALSPMRLILPPGDLLMMRRQLLNLKALAEQGV